MIIKLKYKNVVCNVHRPWIKKTADQVCYATAIRVNNKTYALTAAQLLYNTDDITYNGKEAKKVFYMMDYDLMLLEIDFSGKPTEISENFDSLLYNGSVPLSYIENKCIYMFMTKYMCVIAEPPLYNEPIVFETGAPIFNNKQQLVGITQAMHENNVAINVFITNFIQHWCNSGASSVYSLPFKYSRISDNIVVNEPHRDTLLSINGVSVIKGKLLYKAFKVSPNMYVMLTVHRDNHVISVGFSSGTRKIECVKKSCCWLREPISVQSYVNLGNLVIKPISVIDLMINSSLKQGVKIIDEQRRDMSLTYIPIKDGIIMETPPIIKTINGVEINQFSDVTKALNGGKTFVFEFYNVDKPIEITLAKNNLKKLI
jgi:hypothetical protein